MTRQTLPLREAITEALPGFACGARDSRGTIQLRMNNVDTLGAISLDDHLRVPCSTGQAEKYRLEVGDVLFNNTNSVELVGKSAVFRGHSETVVYSNHFTRLRTDPNKLTPEYLASWLVHAWQSGTFAAMCNRWIGQAGVKNDKLLSLQIPLPPLAEQRRMVAELNAQLATIERARYAAEERRKAAAALAGAWTDRKFSERTTRGNTRLSLRDILKLRSDVLHPYMKQSGRGVFVGLEHVESNTGKRLGSLEIDLSKLTGRKPRYKRGDIVYGYLRPYLNKVWVAEFDGFCSVDQYVFQSDPKLVLPEYIAAFMRSKSFLTRAPINVTPGQLPRIRTEEVLSVEVDLPPIPEQTRIVTLIEQFRMRSRQLADSFSVQCAALDALVPASLRIVFGPSPPIT